MPLFNIKHLLKGDKLCQALFFVIEIFVFSYFSDTVALETINISMIRSLLTPIAARQVILEGLDGGGGSGIHCSLTI